jgi:hypothetical protein
VDRTAYRRRSLLVCPHKRRYTTWAEARVVAERSHRQHGWDHQEPYACRGCGGYHVGHPPDGNQWR